MSIPTTIFEYRGGWYAKWYDSASRRTVWKKLAPTKALAQDALRSLQSRLIGGPLRSFARITVSQYYTHHYEPDYLPTGKTWNNIQRNLVRAHILPRWGNKAISDIALYDAQAWYRDLQEQHSRKYANHIVSVFKTMLHRACGKFIAASPVAGLRKAAPEKKMPDTLTREQVTQLSDRLDGRDRVLMLVWIMTGLRPGEMKWLQWCDIDLDAAKLFVRNKKPMAHGNAAMTAGHKIKDSEERYIDLTATAVLLLRQHRGEQTPAPEDFIFPNENGELMMSMPNHIYKVFKRAGMRNGSANLLRHTFASMFLSGGGNLAELKQYMGHSSITITEAHYAAYLPGTASSIHGIDFGIGEKAGGRHIVGLVG